MSPQARPTVGCVEMRPSRGMGAVAPSKMPKPKKVVRKDKPQDVTVFKKGGKVKVKSVSKSKISKASSRGDGIAQRGKTKGRII